MQFGALCSPRESCKPNHITWLHRNLPCQLLASLVLFPPRGFKLGICQLNE